MSGLLVFLILMSLFIILFIWGLASIWGWVIGIWDSLWSWLPWVDDDSENFASPRAHMIASVAQSTFGAEHASGAPSTGAYKKMREELREYGGLDPVEFEDVRNLAYRGRLSPEEVQRVLP